MDRRRFIGTLGAGLALATPFARAGNPTCARDLSCLSVTGQQPLSEDFLKQFYSDKRVSMIGMPDHTDPTSLFMFFSAANINAMQAARVSKALVEFPVAMQPLFDDLAELRVSPVMASSTIVIPWLPPAMMVAAARTIAFGTWRLASAGIRIQCRDIDTSTAADREKFTQYLRGGALDQAANDRILAARMDDRARAELMVRDIDSLGQDSRAVIFHGALHFEDHPHNLKSLMQSYGAPQMNIYSTADSFNNAGAPVYLAPDYICLTEEGSTGTVYTAKTNTAAKKAAVPAKPDLRIV